MSPRPAVRTKMTEGPILPQILSFAFPIMVTGILQILFNAADSLVVGKFVGDDALAAVSSAAPLFNMVINFVMGISVGSNVLVAQHFGAGRNRDVTETVSTSLILAVFLGVLLQIAGIFASKPLLVLSNAPENILDDSALYMMIILLGGPANLLFNFSAAIMRAVGDTRRPMIYLMIACVLNIGLNLFFVLVVKMGVAGVALATVLSWVVSATLSVIRFFKIKDEAHIDFKTFRFDFKKAGAIVRVGLPSGVSSLLFSISNIVIQKSINSFGSIAVAGNGAAYQIEVFIYNTILAFHYGALNFVAQNAGAGRYDRIKKGVLISFAAAFILSVVLGCGSYLLARPLLRFFTDTEEAISFGMYRMFYLVLLYFLLSIMEVSAGAVRGLGLSMTPTIVGFIGSCLLRIVWDLTVFRTIGTPEALYIVYPISWIVTSAGHIVTYMIAYKKRTTALRKPRSII